MANGNGSLLLGRKFWLVVFIYISNFTALMMHHVQEPTYLTITLSVIGGYLLANVAAEVMGNRTP